MSVLAVGLLLAGCKLIDQTTFAPSPEAPTTEAVAPPRVDTRTPLVTIDYGGPPPDYLGLLRFAVHAAETRAPGVEYDVIGMLPAGGDAAAEQRRAVEVMRAIMGQGCRRRASISVCARSRQAARRRSASTCVNR